MANSVLDFTESGGNVIGTISGSLDLTGDRVLSTFGLGSNAFVESNATVYSVTSPVVGNEYFASGPGSFGNNLTVANSTTINVPFALFGLGRAFFTPASTDKLILTGELTFLGQTFASMDLIAGSYVYTFDNGQTFTVDIGQTPIPPTLPLFLTGLAGLAWVRRRAAV